MLTPITRLFRGDRQGLLFIAPALAVFVLVLAFPIGYAINLSFYKIRPNFVMEYAGLQNFRTALEDPVFWGAIKNTLVYTVSSVGMHLLIGFALALLLNARWLRARLLFRLLLLPWTLSFVVVGVTWRWVLSAQYGILNYLLSAAGIIPQYMTFLGSAEYAMPAAILVNVWRGYPFVMVMIYAALQLVPIDQVEAAVVDGATQIGLFRHVTLPNIRGILLVATVLDSIWVFIQFDLTQVLTAGGPGHVTELLSNLIYRTSFVFYDFGLGSAIAVLMLVMVLALSLLYVKLLGTES